MKVLSLIMAVLIAFGSISVCADEDVIVTKKYTSAFNDAQGFNNFYKCVFIGKSIYELEWYAPESKWIHDGKTLPCFQWDLINPTAGKDIGFKFVAPETGMIRLKGETTFKYPKDSSKGNGCIMSIWKGSTKLWEVGPTSTTTDKYNITTSVRKGQELYFKINAAGSEAWDWAYWYPTVEYLGGDMVNDDKSTYYQKDSDGMKELTFDSKTFGYTADDGIAFISSWDVFPTDKYSLVKRSIADASGRYRLYSTFKMSDKRSGGNIVSVYKNNEKIWEQMIAIGEEQVLDIGFWANKDDVIDVEVGIKEYTGFNHTEWECSFTRYLRPYTVEASGSVRRNTGYTNEMTLGSYVGSTYGPNAKYYTLLNDVIYPMTYNSGEKKWKSTVSGDGGFISAKEMKPCTEWSIGGESVMELTLPNDGIFNIQGPLEISGSSDGVLFKIFINDELIWSNRVGGERPVRWDEPYDVCYFQNYINAVADVTQGDVLKISVNRWRKADNDNVGIGNVFVRYLTGNAISETTEWKLDNSIVIDTSKKMIYKEGKADNLNVYLKDGTTYIGKEELSKISVTDYEAEDDYVSLRRVAESSGMNVCWVTDGIILVYDYIPVFFSYPEISEIKTVIKRGGGLFE